MKIKLSTSDEQYRLLLKSFNESRKASATLRIDRTALWNILQDHSKLNGALARSGSPAEV